MGKEKQKIEIDTSESVTCLIVVLITAVGLAGISTAYAFETMLLGPLAFVLPLFIASVWGSIAMWLKYENIIRSIERVFEETDARACVKKILVLKAANIATLELTTHKECAKLAGLGNLKEADVLRGANDAEIEELRLDFTLFRGAAEALGVRALFNDPRHYVMQKNTPASYSDEQEHDGGGAAPVIA